MVLKSRVELVAVVADVDLVDGGLIFWEYEFVLTGHVHDVLSVADELRKVHLVGLLVQSGRLPESN